MSQIIAAFQNGSLMSGRADNFFRYHDGERTEVDWDGEDGGPLGYFTLREVTSEVISAYVSEHGDPWASKTRNLSPGWYVDVRGEDGTVWAFQYDNEDKARRDYNAALAAHIEWLDANTD